MQQERWRKGEGGRREEEAWEGRGGEKFLERGRRVARGGGGKKGRERGGKEEGRGRRRGEGRRGERERATPVVAKRCTP